MSQSARLSDNWKVSFPCTRAEAEALGDEISPLIDLPDPPVLMASEVEEDNPLAWRIDAYFDGRPTMKAVTLLHDLLPSAAHVAPVIEQLPDEDWVALSQSGLEPVTAGRFHVRNRAGDPVPPGLHPLLIPAGRAFGTGQHETTGGCLAMLDRCRAIGMRFGNIADIGTGTGVLAFAALHLWPRACATASDIDPASVEVTAQNAALNGVVAGPGQGELALWEAAGVGHPALLARAPYDLLIANILAGPLIELAPALCAVVEDGGTIILAGLLDEQADAVIAAYRGQAMRLADRIDNGRWPCLRLRKRPAIGYRRPRRWSMDASGEAPGFGSW